MRILIVSTLINPTPPPKYGGIERFVHDLASELAKTEEILVVRRGGSKKVNYRTIETTEKQLINTVKKALQDFKPDVVQINQKFPQLFDFLKKAKIKKVITIHNNFRKSSSYNEEINKLDSHFYITAISKSLKNRIYESLIRHNIKIDNSIEVLGYGLNLDNIKANEKKTKPYYIYLGNIARYKGVLNIAKAFTHIKKNLLIVGPANSIEEKAYFDEVMQLAEKSSNLKYYGVPKNDKEKFSILKNSCGLVIATGYDKRERDCHEAFGLVMLEANALGVPVIGYKKGNIQDYVVDGKNGYKFSSINEIKEITNNIEKNSNNLECEEIAKKYAIKKIAKKYRNFFYKLHEK